MGLFPPKIEFFPDNEPQQILVSVEYPEGTDILKTNGTSKLVENEILLADKIDRKKMKEMSKKDHSMSHSHANSVLLEPNETGEIIWKFSKNISLEMACNMPGHYEVGMVGQINLK